MHKKYNLNKLALSPEKICNIVPAQQKQFLGIDSTDKKNLGIAAGIINYKTDTEAIFNMGVKTQPVKFNFCNHIIITYT